MSLLAVRHFIWCFGSLNLYSITAYRDEWVLSVSLLWLSILSSKGHFPGQRCHFGSTSCHHFHLFSSASSFHFAIHLSGLFLSLFLSVKPPLVFKHCTSLQAFTLTFSIDPHHCYCVCYVMLCLAFVLLCLFPVGICILIHWVSQGHFLQVRV